MMADDDSFGSFVRIGFGIRFRSGCGVDHRSVGAVVGGCAGEVNSGSGSGWVGERDGPVGVRPFDLTGRPMRGWVVVAGEVLDDDVLDRWVAQARTFVAGLPPK
ncbi:MAG: hypothetical protein QOH90_2129 [Actinomycetota bacterium]|nr:hypothetical protein [Actinomycetota bacterium]